MVYIKSLVNARQVFSLATNAINTTSNLESLKRKENIVDIMSQATLCQ